MILIGISLKANFDLEHIVICFLALYVSPLAKCQFRSYAFFQWVIRFCFVEFKIFGYFPALSVLSVVRFTNSSPHSTAYLAILNVTTHVGARKGTLKGQTN